MDDWMMMMMMLITVIGVSMCIHLCSDVFNLLGALHLETNCGMQGKGGNPVC